MLKATDSDFRISIELSKVPPNTLLDKLINGSTDVPIKKDPDGAIWTSSTELELKLLKTYLDSGKLNPENLISCVQVLDYYGIYQFKCPYPDEFISIKLEEDWYRKNLYVLPQSSFSPLEGCIELTDSLLKSFTLMNKVHFLYVRSIYTKKAGRNNDLQNLVTKDTLDLTPPKKHSKQFKKYFLHSFPRPYVLFTDESQLVSKIKDTNSEFLSRDSEFDFNLIRESLRKKRGQCDFKYTTYTNPTGCGKLKDITTETLHLNWENTLMDITRRITTSKFWSIFSNLPDFWSHVLLAGGSVLNLIVGCRLITDYDLFIHSCSIEEATNLVKKIIKCVRSSLTPANSLRVLRTTNSITLKIQQNSHNPIKIQIILRLYSSISEILHGFDVDCSCVGFDGSKFYMTRRAQFGISNMVNTVDFDRMSPTYEFRLAKYMARGFSVHVPDFKWSSVKKDQIVFHLNQKDKFRKQLDKIYSKVGDSDDRLVERAKLKSVFGDVLAKLTGIEILIYAYFGLAIPGKTATDYGETRGGSDEGGDRPFFIFNLDGKVISYMVKFEARMTIDTRKHLFNAIFDIEMFPKALLVSNEKPKCKGRRTVSKGRTKKVVRRIMYKRRDETSSDEDIFSADEDEDDSDEKQHTPSSSKQNQPKFDLPTKLEWKITNPGEQFTGTFHKLVYDNPLTWYESRFM